MVDYSYSKQLSLNTPDLFDSKLHTMDKSWLVIHGQMMSFAIHCHFLIT